MSTRLPMGEYYGEVLESRQVAGLVLTETVYAPDVQLPKHSHANAYFCLVRQGAYTESYNGRTRRCSPLMLAFHPPEEVHAQQFHEGPAVSFNIELGPAWLPRLGRHGPAFESGLDFQGGEPAALALKLHREFHLTDGASALAIEGLTLELLATACRSAAPVERRRPPWLERAWQLVQDRYHETLTLSDVAGAVGVHPVHLACTFRRHYGCSLGDAVRRRRIEFAAGRLAVTADSLADIARAAGFADQSHFSNTFKKVMGMTPSVFRRSVISR
jgi:AraC family transcriptional regulator